MCFYIVNNGGSQQVKGSVSICNRPDAFEKTCDKEEKKTIHTLDSQEFQFSSLHILIICSFIWTETTKAWIPKIQREKFQYKTFRKPNSYRDFRLNPELLFKEYLCDCLCLTLERKKKIQTHPLGAICFAQYAKAHKAEIVDGYKLSVGRG
jgi:hypothetical protein